MLALLREHERVSARFAAIGRQQSELSARLTSQFADALKPSLEMAKLVEAFGRQSFQVSGLDRFHDLGRQVDELTRSYQAQLEQIRVPTLMGSDVALARLQEHARLTNLLSASSVEGLFGGLNRRLAASAAATAPAGAGLADVVAASAAEIAALPESDLRKLDAFTIVEFLLMTVFAFVNISMAMATDDRVRDLADTVEDGFAMQKEVADSLTAAIESLLSSSLTLEDLQASEVGRRLSRGLLLRVGPGTEFASRGRYEVGTKAFVLEESDAWTRVAVQDEKVGRLMLGWMYSKYLREPK